MELLYSSLVAKHLMRCMLSTLVCGPIPAINKLSCRSFFHVSVCRNVYRSMVEWFLCLSHTFSIYLLKSTWTISVGARLEVRCVPFWNSSCGLCPLNSSKLIQMSTNLCSRTVPHPTRVSFKVLCIWGPWYAYWRDLPAKPVSRQLLMVSSTCFLPRI